MRIITETDLPTGAHMALIEQGGTYRVDVRRTDKLEVTKIASSSLTVAAAKYDDLLKSKPAVLH